MVPERDWINLPVGYNLEDHTNVSQALMCMFSKVLTCLKTDIVISHPDVVHYDFYQSYTEPIESDKTAYLGNNSGIDVSFLGLLTLA
jgi:cellobiose dehydrogenase (acceptor)